MPLDAPEGETARPIAPDSRCTSASTVGLPRESRIWRPRTTSIALIAFLLRIYATNVTRRPLHQGADRLRYHVSCRAARAPRHARATRDRCAVALPAH